jgi:hypothetical protein
MAHVLQSAAGTAWNAYLQADDASADETPSGFILAWQELADRLLQNKLDLSSLSPVQISHCRAAAELFEAQNESQGLRKEVIRTVSFLWKSMSA